MKDRDNFRILNFMKKQNQITLVRLSTELIYMYTICYKGVKYPNGYLTTDIDRTQQFYLLPKIHKDPLNPPGRPIVSGGGGPTEKIFQLVDHFIGQIVPLSQSYIRDSAHLINILNGFTVQSGIAINVPWALQVYIPTYLIMKVFNPLKKCWPFTNHLTVFNIIVIS